jgi:hypothetical protein
MPSPALDHDETDRSAPEAVLDPASAARGTPPLERNGTDRACPTRVEGLVRLPEHEQRGTCRVVRDRVTPPHGAMSQRTTLTRDLRQDTKEDTSVSGWPNTSGIAFRCSCHKGKRKYSTPQRPDTARAGSLVQTNPDLPAGHQPRSRLVLPALLAAIGSGLPLFEHPDGLAQQPPDSRREVPLRKESTASMRRDDPERLPRRDA